jgi:hypothetical protein
MLRVFVQPMPNFYRMITVHSDAGVPGKMPLGSTTTWRCAMWHGRTPLFHATDVGKFKHKHASNCSNYGMNGNVH